MSCLRGSVLPALVVVAEECGGGGRGSSGDREVRLPGPRPATTAAGGAVAVLAARGIPLLEDDEVAEPALTFA